MPSSEAILCQQTFVLLSAVRIGVIRVLNIHQNCYIFSFFSKLISIQWYPVILGCSQMCIKTDSTKN